MPLQFYSRDQPERCLFMDYHHSASDAAIKGNTTEKTKIPGTYFSRSPSKNAHFICPSLPKFPPRQFYSNEINSSSLPSSPVINNGRVLSSEVKDSNVRKELVNKIPQPYQLNNFIDINNTNKIDSFDARTRLILSNSVLAKSRYQDRIRFRNQFLSKSISENAIDLTHPCLPTIITENKKAYTAHDIAAAKLLLSHRQQDMTAIHILAKKLSMNNFPRKKNNVAARLA